MKVQMYGLALQGRVTCAGVHVLQKITPVGESPHAQQLRWRGEFLKENAGDYPIREDAKTPDRRTVAV